MSEPTSTQGFRALLPTLTVIALNVAWLLGGVVVVENVFNYPGMGKLMLESVYDRDLPTIEAIALLSAVVYVVCNLAADLVALVLDPKLRTRQRRTRVRRAGTASRTRKAAA